MTFNNFKYKKILLILFLPIIIFLISFFTITKVHAAGANEKYEDPKMWPNWTQEDTNQSWNVDGGGFGHGGFGHPENEGCYVTSAAIQGARSGITKTKDGKKWNPGTITNGGALGQSAYSYDGGTFKLNETIGGNGSYTSSPAMGEKKAKDAIKSIIKKGEFPILHMDGASGYPYPTHFVAVRKMEGNNVSVYDPARWPGGKNSLSSSPGKTYLTCAAYIEGWGGGPKTIDKAASPEPSYGDGKADSSSSGKDSKSGNKSKSGAPEIKPTFNPFRMATPNNTSIGYDTEEKNSADNRGSRLEFMDKWGPVAKVYVQDAALIFIYASICYIIVVSLLQILDELVFGGFLSEKASETKAYKILFPANTEFGSIAKFKRVMIVSVVVIFVAGLIVTDTMSIFLGDTMLFAGKLFEHILDFF